MLLVCCGIYYHLLKSNLLFFVMQRKGTRKRKHQHYLTEATQHHLPLPQMPWALHHLLVITG